jgi:hypothetical protein
MPYGSLQVPARLYQADGVADQRSGQEACCGWALLTVERISPVPEATELLHSNLHEVFSERNPERRRAAIGRTYTEDVTFIDPDGEFVGWQALSDQAQKLLDGLLAGYVFEEDGPWYVGTDTAALAWRFGPPGKPIARGVDILTIREGRVSVVRTLIAPESEA